MSTAEIDSTKNKVATGEKIYSLYEDEKSSLKQRRGSKSEVSKYIF